jgi:hypothetical protein
MARLPWLYRDEVAARMGSFLWLCLTISSSDLAGEGVPFKYWGKT